MPNVLWLLSVAVVLSCFQLAASASNVLRERPLGCSGASNPHAIITDPPVYVKQVKNGKLYLLDKVTPPIRVMHLWGSHYEMGYAMGQLYGAELQKFLEQVVQYGVTKFADMAEKYVHLPKELVEKLIYRFFISGMESTLELTKDYTPKYYFDEIKGIAEGAHVDEHQLLLMNQIPEMLKAWCTMMGAWGPAVREVPGATLLQLRALDWAIDGPFNDYPTLFVYHPDAAKVPEPGAHTFAHFGYPGITAAFSGISEAEVGISQRLNDVAWGKLALKGYPWAFLLRDILEFDDDTTAALNRIFNARRTVSIWIGLGDNYTNQFRMVEYAHDEVKVYSDRTSPYKPNYEGVIYNGPDAGCLSDIIKAAYGKIDVGTIINMTAMDNTGQTHEAIYDYGNGHLYLAHTSSASTPPIVYASQRPFVRVDLQTLWNEPRPTAAGDGHRAQWKKLYESADEAL